jgi:hypothetical protein
MIGTRLETAEQNSNPFPGLVALREGQPIFERDSDVDLIGSSFWAGKCLVLFAGSGVGKSSFIHAKLIPTLRADFGDNVFFIDWFQQKGQVTPATHAPSADAIGFIKGLYATIGGRPVIPNYSSDTLDTSPDPTIVPIVEQIETILTVIRERALKEVSENIESGQLKANFLRALKRSWAGNGDGSEATAKTLFQRYTDVDAEALKQHVLLFYEQRVQGQPTSFNITKDEAFDTGHTVTHAFESVCESLIPSSKPASLVVLDQFEELFQRLSAHSVERFGEALKRIISPNPFGEIRLLIGIREEFISQLSHIDSFVPGILSNYYSLKKPTRDQVSNIIRETAAVKTVEVAESIGQLLEDLAVLPLATKQPHHLDIDLPYMQVVCHRLWAAEQPDSTHKFLRTYTTGTALAELEQHCREPLDAMSRKRRGLVRTALGYLTGPHGAKRPITMRELASDIGQRNVSSLREALLVLSGDKVKILRATPIDRGRDTRFELYHDMYAPLLWRWLQEQERKVQRSRIVWTILICSLLWWCVINPLVAWWRVAELLHHANGSPNDIKYLIDVRNTFSHTLILRPVGDWLWDYYTKRFFEKSALRADVDGTILFNYAHAGAGQGAAQLGPARFLLGTYRPSILAQISDTVAAATDDLFAGTVDGRIVHWLKHESEDGSGRYKWTEDIVIPEPLLAGWTPGYRPSQGRILCFGPKADYAVLTWIESKPDEKSATSSTKVLISKIATRTVRSARNVVQAGAVLPGTERLVVFTEDKLPQRNPFDPQIVQRQEDSKAVLKEDGTVALLVNGRLFIIDATLHTRTEQQLPTEGHDAGASSVRQDIKGLHKSSPKAPSTLKLELLGFAMGTNYLVLLRTNSFFEPSGYLQFWNYVSKRFESPYGSTLSSQLYPRAATLIFDKGRLLFPVDDGPSRPTITNLSEKSKNWTWKSIAQPRGDSDAGQQLRIVGDPVAYDSDRQILVSRDYEGNIALTDLSKYSSLSTTLGISESVFDPTAGSRRLFTQASASMLPGNHRLLSIDGVDQKIVRLWDIPDTSEWTIVQRRDLNALAFPKTCEAMDEGNQIYQSTDKKWYAKLAKDDGLIIVNASNPSLMRAFGKLPQRCELLDNVLISSGGRRVLLFYPDKIWLLTGSGEKDRSHTERRDINDAVFGPGSNHVTFISNSLVVIDGPGTLTEPWTEETPWRETCVCSGLVHDTDEDTVVMYSHAWVHWLRWQNKEPNIVSAISPIPISVNGLSAHVESGKTDNKRLLILDSTFKGKTVDLLYTESELPPVHLTSWEIEPCAEKDHWYDRDLAVTVNRLLGVIPPANHEYFCAWMQNSGR